MRFLDPVPDRHPDSPADRDRRIANLAGFYATMRSSIRPSNRRVEPEPKPEPRPPRAVRRTSDGREFESAAAASLATGSDAQVIRTIARRAERCGIRSSWEYLSRAAEGVV